MMFESSPVSLLSSHGPGLTITAMDLQFAARGLTRTHQRRRGRRTNSKEFQPLPTLYEEASEDRWGCIVSCEVRHSMPKLPMKHTDSSVSMNIYQMMKKDGQGHKDVQPYLPLRKPVRRGSLGESEKPTMNTLEMIDQVLSELDLNDPSIYGDE
jgi:hypothetical protein